MAWSAKNKKIKLESVNGHTHQPAPGIVGRAPIIRQIQFSPQELFGAMARCSTLHPVDPDAVTPESESCRSLIAHHVDESPEDFAILPSAKRLKDFSRTHLIGVVGQGIAYLQMIKDGYVWCDHFENLSLSGKALTSRSPDFAFSHPGHRGVAITESKATHGSSRKSFSRTIAKGYVEQLEPFLGMEIGGAIASHGFAIGSWMTSPTRAELIVDHTAVPEPATLSDGVPGDPTAVKRGNYLTVLALMFGAAVKHAARGGLWPSSDTTFVLVNWLGREWVVGTYNPAIADPSLTRLLYLFEPPQAPQFPSFNVFALERGIAELVLRSLARIGEERNLLAELRPIDDDLQARGRAAGGAIYPDGFAVIGNVDDLVNIRVLEWDPNGQMLKSPEQIVRQEVEASPTTEFQVVPEEWHFVQRKARHEQPLQITLRLTE